jgi:glycerol-3-phosphate dehydrogenase
MNKKFKFINPDINYGVSYQDGQFDDVRLCLDNILTATLDEYIPGMKGANILNYTAFKNFTKNGLGKINGVILQDQITKKEFTVKTRCVVNCTGIHSDQIRKIDDPSVEPRMIASEGTHVILPGEYVNKNHGLILPATEDGRVIFVLPYQDKALVGTTDNIYPEKTNNPKTDPNALVFLCRELQKIYPLRTEDELRSKIISYWTGLFF